jgi:toxin FitB
LLIKGKDHLLTFDAEVGRAAGKLSDKVSAAGRHPGFADVGIAATAKVHGLVVLTCNGKHFQPLGVKFVDPLKQLPG